MKKKIGEGNSPLWEAVSDYEEAILLSTFLGKEQECNELIDGYSAYFADPVPYEVDFFCKFSRGRQMWRVEKLDDAEEIFSQCREFALLNQDSLSASRCSMALGASNWTRGNTLEALDCMEKAETGLRECRDFLLASCLNWMGVICTYLSQLQRAWAYYREALELNEELGCRENQGYVLSNLGMLCERMDLLDQAESCYRDSIEIDLSIGNMYGYADALENLGRLLMEKRLEFDKAEPLLAEAARIHIENKTGVKAAAALAEQAKAAFHSGEVAKSDMLFEKSLEFFKSGDYRKAEMVYLVNRARVFLETGNLEEAERLLSRGVELKKSDSSVTDTVELESCYAEVLSQLGQFESAYRQLLIVLDHNRETDKLKMQATETVINALTEKAQKEKELKKIRSEAHDLGVRNKALKLSEERFKGLVHGMTNIGVLAFDENGVVTFWNDTCELLYGIDSNAACGKKLCDLIVPDHLTGWFNSFIIENGTGCGEYEVNLRAADGSMKYVLVSPVSLSRHETFVIQVDITSQRKAENEKILIEAQMARTQNLEALGTMAGGIAHDFNNLLQGILGNAALLCQELEPGTSEAGKAEMILAAAEQSADLCTQMMDFAGIKPVSHEPIDINQVIRDLVVLLQTHFAKDVKLQMGLSSGIPVVLGDKSQIRQVIMNLVLNGAESIDGSGEVRISTEQVNCQRSDFSENLLEENPGDGYYLLIRVEDTGSGMDSHTVSRIFDPFFSTRKTGRGLGLAAVLGIIRAHSGVITVDSAPGKGTVFRVYLQIAADETPPAVFSSISRERGSSFCRKILVVDDEEVVRETIVNILEAAGHETLSVSGGAEALAELEKGDRSHDLMILDLTMPGLSGIDVFRRLRANGAELPVLIVSGYSQDKLSSLFIGHGPEGFLQKPFSPEDLVKKMDEIFASN